jgi:hypothetical protein
MLSQTLNYKKVKYFFLFFQTSPESCRMLAFFNELLLVEWKVSYILMGWEWMSVDNIYGMA